MEVNLTLKIIHEENSLTVQKSSSSTLLELKELILKEIGNSRILESNMVLRLGFPPKAYDSSFDNRTLKQLGISNNELIRLEVIKLAETIIIPNEDNSDSSITNDKKYSVYRKMIPSDNSCLFNAINFAMNNTTENPSIFRELIKNEIISNPDIYIEEVLEKSPKEYCNWITKDSTWGGGIELAILSKVLDIRLSVINLLDLSVQEFGEVRNYLKLEL